jgi:hypothetical protein
MTSSCVVLCVCVAVRALIAVAKIDTQNSPTFSYISQHFVTIHHATNPPAGPASHEGIGTQMHTSSDE